MRLKRKQEGPKPVKRFDKAKALEQVRILRSDNYTEAAKSDAWQRLIGMLSA